MLKCSFLLIFCLVLNSCKDSGSLNENEKEQIKTEVIATLNNYLDEVREKGLVGEFGYLDNSPEFFWVPPGFTSSISFDSVATILKANAGHFQLIDNTWDTIVIRPLSLHFATYTGRMKSITIDTAGKKNIAYLLETGIVIRREDGWKLHCGQTSSIDLK